MKKTATAFVSFILLSSGLLHAQTVTQEQSSNAQKEVQSPIHLELSTLDTTFVNEFLGSYRQFGGYLQNPFFFLDSEDRSMRDTTQDSLVAEFHSGHIKVRKKHAMNFLITEPPSDRITRYIEPFSMIDFNRVNGFFLGLGTSKYIDFGRYDEFGINGGTGYGFTDKKGQNFIGGEYRIPLAPLRPDPTDTVSRKRFISVPTIAVGAEYHNVTTTEDYWRTGRLENAMYAFWAREDFRDYFQINGWSAHLSFRPAKTDEARVEYRSDNYRSRGQLVYYGRFGGDKTLPYNPPVTEGLMHSIDLSYLAERVNNDLVEGKDIFGDTAELQVLTGTAYTLDMEFGNLPDPDASFQRYILDVRRFQPVTFGISVDARLRFESTTYDSSKPVPVQKLEYLGGPSTLPAYKNKVFAGNRMALLNTEIRLNLGLLSSLFKENDVQLILKNDFGYINTASDSKNPFSGFGGTDSPNLIYNVGFGLGHVSGVELGWSWRTDRKENARFFLRFQRPF
jgi:hypothetical protein